MLGCPSERIEFTAGMLAGEEDWWSVHSKPSRCPIYHAKGWALTSCLSESEGGSPEEEKSVRLLFHGSYLILMVVLCAFVRVFFERRFGGLSRS